MHARSPVHAVICAQHFPKAGLKGVLHECFFLLDLEKRFVERRHELDPGHDFLTELVFSPITYLYRIARFGLLISLYGEVVIPR